jgi:hypothetical protein
MSTFILAIFHVFEELVMPGSAQTEELKSFLREPTWPVPNAGMDMPIVQMLQLVDDASEQNEQRTLKLFRSVSKQTSETLTRALQQLTEEANHPCNRGTAEVTTDGLYPLLLPFLRADQDPSLEDLLPILTMLHSGL